MNSNFTSFIHSKLNSQSSQNNDVIEIKYPPPKESMFKPHPIPSYKQENEPIHEYYSSASAHPDVIYYGKVKIEPKPEYSSSISAQNGLILHDQLKIEPKLDYFYATPPENGLTKEHVHEKNSSVLFNNVDYGRSNSSSSFIDYDTFLTKTDLDLKYFIPEADRELGLTDLKKRHPKEIKDIECNY